MLPEDIGITPDLGRIDVDTRILLSLAILVGGLLIRNGAVRLIRGRSAVISEDWRWWMVTVRNGMNALIVVALFVIWAPEIEDFALSIAAFAFALVVATKELILCVSGATWLRTTRAFGIGDWVEIGPNSGEVVDETLFATQLQEIERREFRYTGRTISVPNSQLLTQTVVNHNFRKRFLHHEFTLHAPAGTDAPRVRAAIARALEAEAAGFADVARRYAGFIESRAGVKLPDAAPTVRMETNIYATVEFRCALFCPRERAAELEQVAAAAMFAALARLRPPAAAGVPAGAETGETVPADG